MTGLAHKNAQAWPAYQYIINGKLECVYPTLPRKKSPSRSAVQEGQTKGRPLLVLTLKIQNVSFTWCDTCHRLLGQWACFPFSAPCGTQCTDHGTHFPPA